MIWHGNHHSTGLQGTLTRAMASICVHRASRTPLDSTPGHIRSRDGLQEEPQPATHGRAGPAFPFPAIHLTRQSPFHGPAGHIARAMASICGHRAPRTPLDSTPGHIRSRDGIDLFPSSDPNPSRQHSRAHPLARWFAGRSPTYHRAATHSPQCSSRTFREIHSNLYRCE